MFKVGDKVYDIRFGWGKVNELDTERNYPVCVDFGFDCFVRYLNDGKAGFYDVNPSLFFEEIEIPVTAMIRPRWRATKDNKYYCVNGFGVVACNKEVFYQTDTLFFETGNYFRTEKEAKESKFYKVFHD
ncbi:MAG: hypothetical protein ACRC6E_11330 [Fusobacteriaceae bacterium]